MFNWLNWFNPIACDLDYLITNFAGAERESLSQECISFSQSKMESKKK